MKKTLVVIVVLVVLGALGGGFYLVGPPAEQRARALDERRERDLAGLRLAIDLYWTRNSRLPPTLEELAKEAGTNIYSIDPETGQPYSYGVKSGNTYELCAVFARQSERIDFWAHGAGPRCYAITAKQIAP